MGSLQSKVAKAIKVFTKVQKDLDAVIDKGNDEVVKINNMITELESDRGDVTGAIEIARNIKQRILGIVGDDA